MRIGEERVTAAAAERLRATAGLVRSRLRLTLAPIVSGALAAALVACGGARSEGLDSSKLPENVREDYAIFEQRCSKCHSLARPLGAGIRDDEDWALYVNRMRLQPGSGITMADQERILRFLRHYAAELRKRDDEKRASSAALDASAPAPPPSSATPPPPPVESAAPAPEASRLAREPSLAIVR
jgi:hypothetical protein